MKLMTKALEARFAKLGRQEAKGEEAIVVAKFFTPDSNWTYYATEYDPAERMFFGLVSGFEAELSYFSRDEIEKTVGPMGLHIERDLYFRECTIAQVRAKMGMKPNFSNANAS